MSIAVLLLFFGLANWVSTLILVESELTRGFREWVGRRESRARVLAIPGRQNGERMPVPGKHRRRLWFWTKVQYLVGCHLCAGTWVALAMAAFLPALTAPWLVGWVLNALVIKALGHLVLVLHKGVESWTDRNRSDTAPEPVVHSHVRPVHSFHATKADETAPARAVNEWLETQKVKRADYVAQSTISPEANEWLETRLTRHEGRWSG